MLRRNFQNDILNVLVRLCLTPPTEWESNIHTRAKKKLNKLLTSELLRNLRTSDKIDLYSSLRLSYPGLVHFILVNRSSDIFFASPLPDPRSLGIFFRSNPSPSFFFFFKEGGLGATLKDIRDLLIMFIQDKFNQIISVVTIHLRLLYFVLASVDKITSSSFCQQHILFFKIFFHVTVYWNKFILGSFEVNHNLYCAISLNCQTQRVLFLLRITSRIIFPN